MSNFLDLFVEGETLFAENKYIEARDKYLSAISLDSNHVDVFRAMMKVDLVEEILAGREWYGTEPGSHHALCLFGSISARPGIRPYVHQAYLGRRGYAAFQTAYYLEDLQWLRRYDRLIQSTFMMLYLYAVVARRRLEFIELGSTLFAAYEKFGNCERLLFHLEKGRSLRDRLLRPLTRRVVKKIDFIGVELSDWLRNLSAVLHPGIPIDLYRTWREVPKPAAPRMALSIGVGNYAFTDTAELAEWVADNHITILRERFTLGADYTWQILGKRFTCFSLPEFTALAARHGLAVSLLSYCETGPFLDPTDTPPPEGTVFVEAYLAVHRIAPREQAAYRELIRSLDAPRFSSGFNTNPLIVLTEDILERPIGVLQGETWHGQYAKTATDAPAPSQTPAQFDFSSPMLDEKLSAHMELLGRIFETTHQ